ncbi:RDD family protein [Flavobacterium aquidurense]|uniref:RDD domain containing protein n=1 Tax=Flavobacterium aquidurense TaxID=362413 RepID=A0A0Q0XXI3_9FLAO|nr:RDD family protein [Flavobacterium aquidurense]KQB41142.1 RDD domain containing protein [Flavobacterium aquidurense]
MIIFGSKTVGSTVKSGKFDCPNCRREESYKLKNYKKYFHIFFIPLFKIQDLGDELNCFFCNTAYIPGSILSQEQYDTRNKLGTLSYEENNRLGLEPCDFGKRVGAYAIDLAIMYAVSLTIVLLVPSISMFFMFIGFVYFTACDFVLKGSSLGKLALSIKTVDFDENQEILVYNIILRNLVKGICVYFPPLFMTSLLNQDKRAIHDLAAKTMVIDK